MILDLFLVLLVLAQTAAPRGRRPATGATAGQGPAAPARRACESIPTTITVEDGDGIIIRWSDQDSEIIRILGIDTPECRRVEHNLPYDQPFGPEARAFAQGAFAAANEVELLRTSTLDPYGRTLAYAFINGRNYSLMVIKAGYSTETVSHYGDNGLPRESAEVIAAAKTAPVAVRTPSSISCGLGCGTLTEWMKQNGKVP